MLRSPNVPTVLSKIIYTITVSHAQSSPPRASHIYLTIPVVDLRDHVSPCLNFAEMLVEEREIQWRVAVGTPWFIYEGHSGNVDCLDSHSLDIVETVDQALNITTKAQLPKMNKPAVNMEQHIADALPVSA